jgi:adenylate cyclase
MAFWLDALRDAIGGSSRPLWRWTVMSDQQEPLVSRNEDFWYDFLTVGSPNERRNRRIFRLLPHGPRCRLCAAPFAGVAAPVMRMIGKRPADHNPNWCSACFDFITAHHGGAEIELTLLFADIRGSTAMAEGMSPSAYRAILDRFYDVAAQAIIDYDGFVDKFVGDEVVATFAPLLAGDRHAAQAVRAAEDLLRKTGHEARDGPWVAVGAGVHTGVAWMGAVGDGPHTALTAVGDAVNVTARLASVAQPGEILVTADAAAAAGLGDELERRVLELRGKEQQIEVVALQIGPVPSSV